MTVVAKSLSDRFLQRANKEFFAPRGLRVRICKTAAMRQLVGLGAEPEKGKLAAAGHTAETIALQLPIIRRVYNRVAAPPPVPSSCDPNLPSSMAQRRLASLEGHALPLDFEVPPPAPQEKITEKAQGMSMRLEQSRERKKEAKATRNRELLAIAEGRATSLSSPPLIDPNNPSKKELKQARRMEKKAHKAQLAGMDPKKLKKLQNKVLLDDRVEYNANQDLLWIVLLNADQG